MIPGAGVLIWALVEMLWPMLGQRIRVPKLAATMTMSVTPTPPNLCELSPNWMAQISFLALVGTLEVNHPASLGHDTS